MMIAIADQFSFTQIIIVLVLLFIGQMVFFRYMMGRLNSNPADSLVSDRESEILGDSPARSAVGTPRLRRLQPTAKTAPSEPVSSLVPADAGKISAGVPVAKIFVEKAALPTEKKDDPYAPISMAADEKKIVEEAMPLPALVSLSKKDSAAEKPISTPEVGVKIPKPVAVATGVSVDLVAVPPVAKAPTGDIPAAPMSLPPLAEDKPALPAAFVPVPIEPAGSLIQTPETKPEAFPAAAESTTAPANIEEPPPAPASVKPAPAEVPVASVPRRLFVNPFAKRPAPAPASVEAKAPETAPVPITPAPETAPAPVEPAIEAVGEGILAVGGGALLAKAAEPSATADAEESDDVKKRKTPKPAPERSGLILIPPITAGGEAKAPAAPTPETSAPVGAKVEPPAGSLTLTPTAPEAKAPPTPPTPLAPTEPATRLVGRPRIFLPANAPAATAPMEEAAVEKPALEPTAPAGEMEAEKTSELPAVLEPEAKFEPEFVPAPEPVDEHKSVEALSEANPESTPAEIEAKAEPGPEKKTDEPASDEKPVEARVPEIALAELEEKHEASATPEPPSAVEAVEPVSAVPVAAEPPSVPAPEDAKPEDAPEPATPVPVPPLPKSEPEPATAPEGSLSLATTAPAATITTPQPVMSSTDSTTSSSATGRASAQLTLGFEITSLQLTPFFKLGAVQLRPLSNVVSLHLIGAQPENPLAAGISFQIDRVELDGSHIKSLHLKLLGGAQEAATPQPKLQVNSVELSQGSAGSPISITPSDQTSTAVQLLATFTIAAMDFTPSFEIGSLRLEPTSNQVMLRLAPSSRPAALDLPPAFDVSSVQLGGDSQIAAMALTPTAAK